MKPMLFNTEMVRALLENRKTVTRRLVKPQPLSQTHPNLFLSPLCQAGDILYVRETWAPWSPTYGTAPKIHYKADGEVLPDVKWRPSIHMPREAARLFLRVTDVRAERLQNIDDDGVVAEGLEIGAPFDELWDRTIKPTDRARYGWAANPFVWVIEFERISKKKAEKDDKS